MTRQLRPDPFEPFVWSPHAGTLVSLYGLRADWDHVAEAGDCLAARVEAGFLYAHYLWTALAFLLAVNAVAAVVTIAVRLLS